jgi:DNA-binding NarL/FixJ family response regulator
MSQVSSALLALPIALVEDIRLLRDGIVAMLRAEGLRVVAAIRNGEDAVRQILGAEARMVLLDGALANHDGPRLAAAVKQAMPDVKVVVMDMRPAQPDVIDFIRAGVSGFILRDATAADIVGTLRAVANGLSVLPPKLAGVMFAYVASQGATSRVSAHGASRITARENEIIELIANGATNKEIASRLNIAVHTVKSHVHSVLEKLTLTSRLQIANYARLAEATADGVATGLIPRI